MAENLAQDSGEASTQPLDSVDRRSDRDMDGDPDNRRPDRDMDGNPHNYLTEE